MPKGSERPPSRLTRSLPRVKKRDKLGFPMDIKGEKARKAAKRKQRETEKMLRNARAKRKPKKGVGWQEYYPSTRKRK